ncbi:Tudor domain, partial [Trinorchestia longiramus]
SLYEDGSGSSVKDAPCDKISTALLDMNKYFQTTSNMEEDADRKVKWLPNPERLSGSFSAIPTYVDVLGCIHLHPVKSEHRLELLRDSLLLQFRHTAPEMTSVEEGNLQCGDDVVALYHWDHTWHRATVVQIISDEEVEVMFVDFGNKEVLSVRNLRRTQLFGDLPVQRHVVSLADIEPDNPPRKWEKTVLDFLHVNIVSKVCRVTVVPS